MKSKTDKKLETQSTDRPVLAICYDFDKTLSPDDMQAQGYIQSVGYGVKDFWKETDDLTKANEMDDNLSYMLKMLKESEGNLLFKKETLMEYGADVELFPGVEEWFERIRSYGEQKGVIVEHYIISSGLKEMIEGTSVAKAGAFKKIYASSFYYNERGVAEWPAQAVNYTNKTQFLFRIEKGVLDVNDKRVNDYFPPDKLRVPFRNMIYIGDSDTDVPCMKLVNSYGGHSIGVYNSETQDKSKVYKMMKDNRIRYFAPADYSENTELDILVKAIIDRTATNEKLESIHYACAHESGVLSEDDKE
ncbi:MAG: haloacid dehalogenase-like hydrolase [Lachnospiraceae bacterium]|nr:haloacid dehalogenase-like hydrolase [Lachnospiraceae bacterium]